jgi:murein DD-endopeptidase MepM/ murein hydrolase activator NlpD
MRPLAAPIAAATLCLSTAVVHAQTDPAPQDPASAEPSSEPAEEGPAAPDQEAGARGDGGVAPGGGGAAGGEGGGDGGDGPRGDRGDGSRGRGDGGDRPSRRKRGKLRLLRADAKPSKAWFKGRPATFRYAIAGHRRRDIVIQVKRKGQDPKIVRRFERKDVRPRRTHTVDWDGRVDGGRKYARQGSYKFKVRAKRGPAAEARNAAGKPRAGFFKHKFPVRGPHTYGDGLGAGRGHRGADVFARCGTKLQAARAGSVQHEAYQGSGAGHYLVIDGKRDGKDYVYMHLRRASRHDVGAKVRTGETIGRVGASGNATGCHLHFELWSSPGWYEGGDFLDPMPKLHAWDRFS